MSVQRTSVSRTTSLTGAAVFGALAAVITFLIQIPWPVPGFTFLQLDLAEIVDVLAFLLFGPAVGLFTTLIHYLVLNFLPTPSPIFGPFNEHAPRNVAGIRSLRSYPQAQGRGDHRLRHYVWNRSRPSGNHLDSD